MVSYSVLACARRWSHFADFVSRIMCMRLFIAVLFDGSVLDRCAALRDRLHDASRGGSFVERDKLHLTLEFLGECPQSSLTRLTSVLDDRDFYPFDIRISSVVILSRGQAIQTTHHACTQGTMRSGCSSGHSFLCKSWKRQPGRERQDRTRFRVPPSVQRLTSVRNQRYPLFLYGGRVSCHFQTVLSELE